MQEIFTAWKKTASGYSGDIAIPVSFFAGGKLEDGYEAGLEFSVTKVIPCGGTAEPERIVLQSRKDHLFRTTTANPSSFPRLVLTGGKR